MPILSLEELDEILKAYSQHEPFFYPPQDKKTTRCTVAPFLIDSHENELHSENELRPEALFFIKQASARYQQGLLSPPLTETKVDEIYRLLTSLNKDLTGCMQGNEHEIQRAKIWDEHWRKLIATINKEGHQLTFDELNLIQQDILCAYRQKIIQRCSFKPKGKQSCEVDEIRVQDFLININNCINDFSPLAAFEYLYTKFFSEFENDLGLDLQALSRYLNISQQTEYLKKFEEIISRKAMEFIGNAATIKLFDEITKDKELLKQLPALLEKGLFFRNFIFHFPDKKKRDSLLSASMYEIFNDKNRDKDNGAHQDRHVHLLQNMLQNSMITPGTT